MREFPFDDTDEPPARAAEPPARAERRVNERALRDIARAIAGNCARRRLPAVSQSDTSDCAGDVETDRDNDCDGKLDPERSGFTSVTDSTATEFLETALSNGQEVTIIQAVTGKTYSGRLSRRMTTTSTFALIVANGSAAGIGIPIELSDFVRTRRRRLVHRPVATEPVSPPVAPTSLPESVEEKGGIVYSPETFAEQAAAEARSEISRRAAETRLRKEKLTTGRDLKVGTFLDAVDALDEEKARANIDALLRISDETINDAIALLGQKDRVSADFLRALLNARGDIDKAAQKAFADYCSTKGFTGEFAVLSTVLSYVNFWLKKIGTPNASTKTAGVTKTEGVRLKLDRLPTSDDAANPGAIFSSIDFAKEEGKANELRVVHSRANSIAGRLEVEQQQLLVRALVFQYYGVSFEDLRVLPISDLEGTIDRTNKVLARHGFVIHVNNDVAVLAEFGRPVALSTGTSHAKQYRRRLEQHVSGTTDEARALAQAEAARIAERAAEETRRKGIRISRAVQRDRKTAIRSYMAATNNKNRRVADIQADAETFVRGTREEVDQIVAILDASEYRAQKAVAVYLNRLRSETAKEAIAAATEEFYTATRIFGRNRTPEHVLVYINRAIRDAVAEAEDISIREAGKRVVQLTKVPGMDGASEALEDDFVHGGFRLVTGSFDGIKLIHNRAVAVADQLRTEISRNPYSNGKMLTLALIHQYHGVSLDDLARLPLILRPNGDPALNAVIGKTNRALNKFGLAIYVRNGFAILGRDISGEGNVETVGIVSRRQKKYPESPLKREYL